MARAQAQYVRIYDSAGVTYQRWQSYYNVTVTWQGASWAYQPFIADGMTAGLSGDEADITVSAPGSTAVVGVLEAAILNGRNLELLLYQFDTADGNDAPQAEQQLVFRHIGRILSGRGTLTNFSVRVGSAINPVHAQIPPKKLTTYVMGMGCRL
jgi:hypothetical protein